MTTTDWANVIAWVAVALNVAVLGFNAWQLRKIRELRARIAEHESVAATINAQGRAALRAIARFAIVHGGVLLPADLMNGDRPDDTRPPDTSVH